ncbi:MAG: HD domain-containing protein [Bacillota bacterium]
MKGFTGILQDTEFLGLLKEIQSREEDRPFCQHQLPHLMDVARIAYILLLETGKKAQLLYDCSSRDERRAKEIIYTAALLHDIGRGRAYVTGEEHERIGAMLAPLFLEKHGFSPGESTVICRAVGEHRGKDQNPSLLGALLHKADRHSRLCDQCNARQDCYKYPEQALPVIY